MLVHLEFSGIARFWGNESDFLLKNLNVGFYGKINTARKKDRNLDMLTAYCKENQISLYNQSAGRMQNMSDEQIAQYKQLYKALQTSDNMDAVIPIQIDAVTGAGVYIVGKNNVSPKSAVYKKIKENCCYTCFFVDGLNVEDYNGISSFSFLNNVS